MSILYNMNEFELVKEVFEDFKLLKTFKVNQRVKKKLLKELFEALPCPWRVVGVSPSALSAFANNQYRKKGLKIQRAHLCDRDEWYGVLLNTEWKSIVQWYEFILEKDRTVLGLSSENKNINNINYIEFLNDDSELFKSTRISWVHGKKEIDLLKSLTQRP